jgi:WD40 repeat protein
VGSLDWDGESLTQIAVSKDGRTLAAGERPGPTAIYDISGPVAKSLGRLPVETVTYLTFLPDGSLLTAEGDGRLTVWNISRDGTHMQRTFALTPLDFDKETSTRVQEVTVSADGTMLAINCQNQVIRMWDLSREAPAEVAVLHRPGWYWIGALFGSDSKTLYTADYSPEDSSGAVRAWRLGKTGLEEAGVIARDTDNSQYIAFTLSRAGDLLAVSTLRSGVLRFDLSGPMPRPLSPVKLAGEDGSAVRLEFSPDGKTLYTGGAALRAWDLTGPQPVERAPFDASWRVTDSVLAADGTLVAAHADGRLRVWDLLGPTPSVRRELVSNRSGSTTGRLAVPANATFAIQTAGRTGLTVWPIASPDSAPIEIGNTGAVFDLALTPDGAHLITSVAQTLTHWERRDMGYHSRYDLRAVGGWGRCAITSDGAWVAAVEHHAGLKLLHVASDGFHLALNVPTPTTGVPVFSTDGKRLIVIGKDLSRPLRYRLTENVWVEEPFADQDVYPRLHEAVSFPDSRLFVAYVTRPGSYESRLEVWDWETGKVSQSFLIPGRIKRLSVAADGHHVATQNDNGTAYVFRIK